MYNMTQKQIERKNDLNEMVKYRDTKCRHLNARLHISGSNLFIKMSKLVSAGRKSIIYLF